MCVCVCVFFLMFPGLQFSFVGNMGTQCLLLQLQSYSFYNHRIPTCQHSLKYSIFSPCIFFLDKISVLSMTILQVSQACAKCFLTLVWTFALRYHFKRKIPHKSLRNKSPAGDSEPLMKCTASVKNLKSYPTLFLCGVCLAHHFIFSTHRPESLLCEQE